MGKWIVFVVIVMGVFGAEISLCTGRLAGNEKQIRVLQEEIQVQRASINSLE